MKTHAIHAPDWRSLLYVPAHIPRFVDKAATCGADALLLDLEDSVPADRKALARDALAAAVPRLKAAGSDVLVRVNSSLQWLALDLRAAVAAGVGGVAIPKVLGASHLEAIDALLGELEDEHGVAHGVTRVIALVETPGAFEARARIARASPRIAALMLGGGDFALHCESDASADVLNVPKQLLVIAARAAGVLPLGLAGTPDSLDDLDAFARMAQRSKAMGFAGATCIHPAQVPILNRAFAPTDDETRAAQTLVDAYEAARTDGLGALRVDGKMVDAPAVERARRVLARRQAVMSRAQAVPR
ncbi:HpcH/HpaI aldolase/citrate lyase family protein [Burkholderia sp. LMG 32019]|uniref:HpcH/HpaI aldolase/citrate lyase family protein n=1 Tax=Burkholderia sp. LMG 32019 TaxID=3158173 RepID=UPI003C2CD25B